MYLNLDLLYNISDYFQDIYYYSGNIRNVIYNKKTRKIINLHKGWDCEYFSCIDLLNKTASYNFGAIFRLIEKEFQVSDKDFKFKLVINQTLIYKRISKKIELPAALKIFLSNDTPLN